jgi:hypothetical protein
MEQWRGRYRAAVTPLPQRLHEALGTGRHAPTMTELYDQSMPALVDKSKAAIDTMFGQGTVARLPKDFPWIEFAGNLANETARGGMSLLDFGTTPAGLATAGSAPAIRAAATALKPVLPAAFAASMAPDTAREVGEAVAHPTSQNVPKAMVRAAINALPLAATVPLLRNPVDVLGERIAEHNATAADLVEQERHAGQELELAQKIHGEPVPVDLNGTPHTIELAGVAPKTGRPVFQVVNSETGKTAFAGYGGAAQDFLRSKQSTPAAGIAEEPENAPVNGWTEKAIADELDAAQNRGALTSDQRGNAELDLTPQERAEFAQHLKEQRGGARAPTDIPRQAAEAPARPGPPGTRDLGAALDDYLSGRTDEFSTEAETPAGSTSGQSASAQEPAARQQPARTPTQTSGRAAESSSPLTEEEADLLLSHAGEDEPTPADRAAMQRHYADAVEVSKDLRIVKPTEDEITAAAMIAHEQQGSRFQVPGVSAPAAREATNAETAAASGGRVEGRGAAAGGADDLEAHAQAPVAEEAAAGREGISGAGAGGRAAVVDLPLSEIHIDPARFQFKANVGQGGVGDEFRDVTKWDPEKAGLVHVWKDPANGLTYMVNGHHRYEMAARLGVDTITSRYLDASTAQEARTKGALINIAEGRGESTDAAKVFRDSGFDERRLREEGVSLKGAKAKQGIALANLDEGLFNRVVHGDMPAERGAIIGEGVKGHADQRALADMLDKGEKSGKRITNDQLAELIRLTPKHTETQTDLFGSAEMTRSLIREKAEVSDYVRTRLGKEKRLFASVGTEGAAAQLGETGNVIRADVNRERAGDTGAALAIYDKLSASAGPVSEALDRAAAALAKGESSNAVKERSYGEIRQQLVEQAGRLRAGEGAHPAGSGEGAAEPGAGRPREAGQGEHAHDARNAVERRPGERGSLSLKPTGSLKPKPNEEMFSAEENRVSAEERQRGEEKLLGDQLTAQLKSGGAAKPAKLKPAKNRGLFDEPGPEQEGLFGSERGSLPISKEPAGPRLNYSSLGRAKDLAIRNLSQLEKADPEAHRAVVRAATGQAQSATLIQRAAPRIEKALGTDGPSFTQFRKALIEGKLRAIRQRYLKMAEGAEGSSNRQIGRVLETDPELAGLLRAIEGQRGIPQDVIETAAALQDKPSELRDFLKRTFRDAAANVARILPDEEYQRIRSSAGYGRALPVYKQTLEGPLARIHARNEGVFSTAKGDAYYPLIPVSAAEKLAAKTVGKAAPYRKPRNVHNEFATGLATYDAGMDAFNKNLGRAAAANNKAAARQTLEDRGLLRVLDEGERAPDTFEMGGEEYKAAVLETNTGRQQVERSGKSVYRPTVAAVTADFLKRELAPVFEKSELPAGWARKVVNAANWWSIQGPPALAWHGTNLLGTIVANTPFIGEALATKTIGNLTGLKMLTAIGKLWTTDVTTDEAADRFVRMAEEGTLPPHFRSITYSKKFAAQTGAKLARVTLAPLLYGRKGLDARARLLMDRLYDQMVPEAERKTLDRYKFVNQLGNYTNSLESGMARAAKKYGLAPFATAGTTMLRNGINAALGTGPVPGNRWSYRVAQLMTGGPILMAAAWIAIHLAQTAKWPWDDPDSKLMKFPLTGAQRNSPLGRALCGDQEGTCYVSLALFNPLLLRGLGALGATDAFENRQLGGSGGQQLEAGIRGAANAAVHPFVSGPIVRATSVGLLGDEPYLTSIHPPQLINAVGETRPGLPFFGERAKEAALSMNPFFQDVAAGVGLGHKAEEAEKQGAWWLRMAVNLAAPRLAAGVVDNDKKAERVWSERESEEGRR